MQTALRRQVVSVHQDESQVPLMWKISPEGHSIDEIENALNSGIELGMKEREKIIEEQHASIRKSAMNMSLQIYNDLKKLFDIKPVGMRFRTEGYSTFGILYILSENDFLSDKIEDIYNFLNQHQNESQIFRWNFVVMPFTQQFDDSAVASDGYSLSYAEPS